LDDEDEVIDIDSDDEKSKKKAEGVGSSLSAKYAAKDPKGKAKIKKKEEVGPSGQTYTPLEKQFMQIKGENPDVLLLMEGKLNAGISSAVLIRQSDTSTSSTATMPKSPRESLVLLRETYNVKGADLKLSVA